MFYNYAHISNSKIERIFQVTSQIRGIITSLFVNATGNSTKISIPVTTEFSKDDKVLVTYTQPDGEVVAGVCRLSIQPQGSKNTVSYTL